MKVRIVKEVMLVTCIACGDVCKFQFEEIRGIRDRLYILITG